MKQSKPKVTAHEVSIKKYEDGTFCLTLDMEYEYNGEYGHTFITDLPEDLTDKQIRRYIKTVEHAIHKISVEKKAKKRKQEKEMKAEFQQYREMVKALGNTKHDEESLKKAITEFNKNKNPKKNTESPIG